MFAGRLDASSQAASGQLLPVWSDEGHFLEQSLARLKTTQPGGGADRPYEQFNVVEGTVPGEAAMHFTTCEGLDGCVLFNHAKAGASAFHKRYAAQLPKQLEHNPKAHNIGHTSLTFDTT